MRKLSTLLAATATLLFGLNSCNLSIEQDFNFTYEAVYQLSDTAQEEALEPYFQNFFEKHNDETFHGEYSAALERAAEIFIQDLNDIDEAYIQSILASPEDAIRLLLILSSSDTRTVAAYYTWVGEEDPDGGE